MTTQPTNHTTGDHYDNGWPARPVGEVFPELLDSVCVAQLLLYDRRGKTPEQGRRNVRKLVKEAGLPTLGRIGSTLMFRKMAVLEWLGGRGSTLDNDSTESRLAGA